MAKRVLVLGFFSGRHSGMYRFVTEDLIDHLTAIGWQVTGASAYRNRPLRLIDMMLTSWRARPAYDVAVIDVFSGLAFRQAEANVWQLQRLKKPFVLTLHGGNLPEFSKKHPERVRRLLGAAAAVTAPSGYLRGALHHLRADIMLVPNPLDLSLYHYRQRGQFRPRLLYLRALHAVYNPMLAVRVVAHLRSSFPDIQLAMVGPDKGDGTLQAVQAEINRLGVGEQVKIIGGVPKSTVPSWHDQADIFINPTNVDNTPISLMEAMASGLCVVSRAGMRRCRPRRCRRGLVRRADSSARRFNASGTVIDAQRPRVRRGCDAGALECRHLQASGSAASRSAIAARRATGIPAAQGRSPPRPTYASERKAVPTLMPTPLVAASRQLSTHFSGQMLV